MQKPLHFGHVLLCHPVPVHVIDHLGAQLCRLGRRISEGFWSGHDKNTALTENPSGTQCPLKFRPLMRAHHGKLEIRLFVVVERLTTTDILHVHAHISKDLKVEGLPWPRLRGPLHRKGGILKQHPLILADHEVTLGGQEPIQRRPVLVAWTITPVISDLMVVKNHEIGAVREGKGGRWMRPRLSVSGSEHLSNLLNCSWPLLWR
mmetsp:Transcript_25305/g.66304  ORF Transcript_25305/g.66304 Transcript_25305/m.66304 type:complete len:205 (-) Transcript_25305:275-889(-)